MEAAASKVPVAPVTGPSVDQAYRKLWSVPRKPGGPSVCHFMSCFLLIVCLITENGMQFIIINILINKMLNVKKICSFFAPVIPSLQESPQHRSITTLLSK